MLFYTALGVLVYYFILYTPVVLCNSLFLLYSIMYTYLIS